MRNLFDQYKHPENRLTHALVSCLAADTKLLRGFIKWATGEPAPVGRLQIVEQQLPGEEEPVEEVIAEKQAKRRGLPDAWVHDRNSWALILESKIEAPLTGDQLDRHRRMAEKRGFSEFKLVAFVTKKGRRPVADDVTVFEWRELYSWLCRQRESIWACRLTDYMEVMERKLPGEGYLKEGTLTVFSGIPFGNDNPYNYLEAKRLLQQAMEELRKRKDLQRKLGMNPEGEGRPAITGRVGAAVWDFLPLAGAKDSETFTEFPHLTLGIERERVIAIVTVPNGIRREFRRRLLSNGKDGFLQVLEEIRQGLEKTLSRVDGATPWLEILQRHYPSQRAEPVVDARLQFDLRTAIGRRTRRIKVKEQPQWLEAAYDALRHKQSNLQLAVGAVFPYAKCPAVGTPAILDHVANVWLSCRPLLRATVG
jgi:hypothetical protein